MPIKNEEQIKNIRGSLENLLEYFLEDRSESVDYKTLLSMKNELIGIESKLRMYTSDYRMPRKK